MKRNKDFKRIEQNLKLPKDYKSNPNIAHSYQASDRFDFVFWFGDLNYRINGTLKVIKKLIHDNRIEVMLFNDQLF